MKKPNLLRGYSKESFTRAPFILSASDLRKFLQCPRSVYLKILKPSALPPPEPRVPLLLGTFEHKCREILVKELKPIYLILQSTSEIDPVRTQHIVSTVVERVKNETVRKSPSFIEEINDAAIAVLTRLLKEEADRMQKAQRLMDGGLRGVELVENILPISEEHWVESRQLGLKGFIDQVWKLGGGIVPLDIKTGTIRPAGQVDEETRVQLTSYALLMEHERRIECDLGMVYYPHLSTTVPINIDQTLREKTLGIRDQIGAMLKSGREPEPCMNPYCDACRQEALT